MQLVHPAPSERADNPATPSREAGVSATPVTHKEVVYSFREGPRAIKSEYRLGPDAMTWIDRGNAKKSVRYRDLIKVRIYKRRRLALFPPALTRHWRCILHTPNDRVALSSLHYYEAGATNERSRAFILFARALISRVSKANPDATIEIERSRLNVVLGRCFVALLRIARRFPLESSTRVCARLLRVIGPWLPPHRTALRNLAIAYPEKSRSEIEHIAHGMWNNLGRVFAEWPHLDRLSDSHISFTPETQQRFLRMRDGGKPALLFGAHLANWELPAAALTARGLDLAVVFRRTRLAAVADELRGIRSRHTSGLILAKFGAAFEIDGALANGTHVGMLIDHHSRRGVDVLFFGQRTKISPALARLARLHDCPIYGGRVIRLADNRYHVELYGPLDLPRDAEGRVDIKPTMQAVASTIEGWVREHPEQWRWLYRWWR